MGCSLPSPFSGESRNPERLQRNIAPGLRLSLENGISFEPLPRAVQIPWRFFVARLAAASQGASGQ
ncbi:hypothetical protein GCM10010833_31210 [Blastomonas aquatica]|uniref:Uncharacterized protein n=1 Tax=Blastomonas aquatica TaxID=1510276 RepID=A0ABQ1JSR5_9SPHN|nr:hypothetical protein GCM10010833_31210 [Blastomonas aquatica]